MANRSHGSLSLNIGVSLSVDAALKES